MDEYWSRFLEYADGILAPDANQTQMDELQSALTGLEPLARFHVGHHDKGVDLILSAEGDLHTLRVLEEAARRAPPLPCRLIVHWDADILFGQRDSRRYPKNENGDILYGFARRGDVLCVPRQVTFSSVFQSRESAEEFASQLGAEEGLAVRVSEYETASAFPWQAEVEIVMAPLHTQISEVEARLGAAAGALGGRNDGWGFFQVTETGDGS